MTTNYKTSEAKRAAQRKYREKNLEYYREYAKAYNPAYHEMNKEQLKAYSKAQHLKKVMTFEGRTSKIFQGAKGRAKKADIEFTLEYTDIVWNDICPLLNIPIDYSYTGARQWASPSLDRVDSTKGYVPGNVRVVSWRANMIKSCSTPDELITMASNIEAYCKG